MKKTVFLTGATGNMGRAGFRELLKKKDRFNIRILARPSKKNKKALAVYASEPAVEIIWGDLTDYDDVLKGVTGADFVLHVGGMVSPQADYYPEKTLKVNVTSVNLLATLTRLENTFRFTALVRCQLFNFLHSNTIYSACQALKHYYL